MNQIDITSNMWHVSKNRHDVMLDIENLSLSSDNLDKPDDILLFSSLNLLVRPTYDYISHLFSDYRKRNFEQLSRSP